MDDRLLKQTRRPHPKDCQIRNLLACLLLAASPEKVRGGDPLPSLDSITPEQLVLWYRQPENSQSGYEMNAAVWASRRFDLIQAAAANSPSWIDMHREIASQPESDFKNDVVLQLLRINAGRFLSCDEVYPAITPESSPYPRLYLEPYRSLIMKYLPGIPLEDRLVSTKFMRVHLADGIEEAKAHPDRVPEIIERLRAYPTADPDYNNGEGRVATQKLGDPPLPFVGPLTPGQRARGQAWMAEVAAEGNRQFLARVGYQPQLDPNLEPATANGSQQAALNPPPQASQNPPPAPVNVSRPRAPASSWLLWTGLAAFNAVVLLTLWLTSRGLRRREHGI